jgi:outer membrane protein assembly factor BamD (BamD/ComL family)
VCSPRCTSASARVAAPAQAARRSAPRRASTPCRELPRQPPPRARRSNTRWPRSPAPGAAAHAGRATPKPPAAAAAARPGARRARRRRARKGDDAAATLLKTAQAKIDAQLLDQALEDLKKTVASYRTSATAPAAQLLIGRSTSGRTARRRAGRLRGAAKPLRPSAAAADATYQLAELVAKGKRGRSRRRGPRAVRRGVRALPEERQGPQALTRKPRSRQGQAAAGGTELQASVPASLVTYRSLVRTYPSSPVAEPAYEALSERYKDVRQFTLAAEALEQLASPFPRQPQRCRLARGEIYEDKVKDQARARAAYALVPSTLPRYRDAQKKLR